MMKSPTEPYKKLQTALGDVQRIVHRVPKTECVSALDHLKVQAFILLAHAAFEQYFEELVTQIVVDAHSQLKDSNRVCKAMLCLVSSEAMLQQISDIPRRKIQSSVANDLLNFATHAKNKLMKDIHGNNGVTTKDQKKMLLPIGVDPEVVNLDISAALNAFGIKRGGIAHKFKMSTTETRNSIVGETSIILSGLLDIDAAACGQLREGMTM
jgi:hypothetical protein